MASVLTAEKRTTGRVSDRSGELVREEEWIVTTDERDMDEELILASPKIPNRGDLHEEDFRLRVQERELVGRGDTGTAKNLRIIYSNITFPTSEVRISTKSEEIKRASFVDAKGRPFVNLLGEPLPPQEIPVTVWNFTGSRELDDIPQRLVDVQNKINRRTIRFKGLRFPPNTLHVADVGIDETITRGDQGDRTNVQVTLRYKRDGWFRLIPNTGTSQAVMRVDFPTDIAELLNINREINYERDAAGNIQTERITDSNDEPIDKPRLLDRRGLPVTFENIINVEPADPENDEGDVAFGIKRPTLENTQEFVQKILLLRFDDYLEDDFRVIQQFFNP